MDLIRFCKMNDNSINFPDLLRAISFAAREHKKQVRKDNETPYVAHVYRVAFTLGHLFEVRDPAILVTAVLHDTIEDTEVDYDDIAEEFGQEIATWVAMLSKDKRLEFHQRERAYEEVLANAPWQVQICKLADIYDNLMDLTSLPESKRLESLRKKFPGLMAIHNQKKPEFEAALQKTMDLYQQIEIQLTSSK